MGIDPDELDWRPADNQLSPLFLDHLVATGDVRVAALTAARAHGWAIAEWIDDRTLKRTMKDTVTITGPTGATQKVAIVPDGYFVVQTAGHLYRHFLEVDRGTETASSARWGAKDWARKVRGYLAYLHSGTFGDRYKARSFRVLTVTTSATRLATLKRVTEEAGGKTIFWFTTLSQVTPEAILTEPVWQVASSQTQHALVE